MGAGYLARRRLEVDPTEWLDILAGLRALGARRGASVFEPCAGEGLLVGFLRARGFRAWGCDLLYSGGLVYQCDLERDGVPRAEYYVFQHCLEHLTPPAALRLLGSMLRQGVGVVGVLPGHHVDDPTHVVNHYHPHEVEALLRRAGARSYLVRPDTKSYMAPQALDWLVVASRRVEVRGRAHPPQYLPLAALLAAYRRVTLALERRLLSRAVNVY